MDREQQILALIRQNPFISQIEIASVIGISRSAVAGYIAALTKKGTIRGRAYVTSDELTIMCIGGANLDSKAASKQAIRLASSNPVTVTESCGGVARNIAETLAGLSCRTALLTVVGDDKAGQWVLEETRKRGVDVSQTIVLQGENTGTYTAVIDTTGEMFLAFANMEIYDKCTPQLLMDKWSHIAASQLVIADTNLPAGTLQELIKRCKDEGISLFIDPVSSEKAKKLPQELHGVTAIFPNLEEACQLAGASIEIIDQDYDKLARAIRARGVKHVFITLGSAGVMYVGEEGEQLFPPIPTNVVEVTGAGDALVAGIAYGVMHQHTYMDACSYGLAAAHVTLQTDQSVASELTEERLQQTIQSITKGVIPIMNTSYLTFTDEVKDALANNKPIVALETTIISHGMPYPQNIEMAKKVEQIIRDNGAVPATIGIMDGKIKIGLNEQELEAFATTANVEKVSRRDFPYILSSGKIGATTVAATMIGAALAGIEVFATGGIGGVHREGEVTMDVSADLTELAQTNVAVVCAGVKSILDIGRTLEYLETHGVPVVGFKTSEFPSFYARESGYGVDFRLDEAAEVAAMLRTKWELGLAGGAIIANPVPAESAMDHLAIEGVIQQALAEAKDQNVTGKKVTPFLLARIKQLTEGRSLETNIALVYHNAQTAAQVAVALKK